MLSDKHVFWQALIVALIVFWTGIMLGVLFEDSRANKLKNFYFDAETDIFDVELEFDLISELNFNCDVVLESNIDFADRIYAEARELEKYDSSTKITNEILGLHKRYDLLRVMLWRGAIKLREKCGNRTNVVVYLYDYNEPPVNVRAKQGAISNVLLDAKEKYGDKIVLIPIAHDTGVRSLELLREEYELTEVPVVIVNQKHRFTNLFSLEDLEKVIL